LHDELSANLHAIVLLSDMAAKNMNTHKKQETIIKKIQLLSRCGRNATRHCMNMLQADSVCENLVLEMKHSSDRLLADIQNDLIFEGEPFLLQLPKQKRIGLFLFYK
jgi:hypothetical protein